MSPPALVSIRKPTFAVKSTGIRLRPEYSVGMFVIGIVAAFLMGMLLRRAPAVAGRTVLILGLRYGGSCKACTAKASENNGGPKLTVVADFNVTHLGPFGIGSD